ncbi:hypothetical protein FRC09_006864 [Ceratobasidium sp. 395]|nr:hypothetical protein FRC09_006864 [Ceratobasidium sp. 395]
MLLAPTLKLTSVKRPNDTMKEATLWISTFVSSSVKTIHLSAFGGLGYLTIAAVLSLLPQKAPELSRFSHDLILVPNTSDRAFDAKSVASQLILSPVACSHLQNLQRLSDLTVVGQFIDPAILCELSRLPNLHSLSIRQGSPGNQNLAMTFKDVQLPIGSFPCLQDFCLESIVLDDIVAAWSIVPLVSGLTKVTLDYSAEEPRGRTIYDKDVLLLVLPLLSASSPGIKELILNTNEPSDGEMLSINLTDSPWTHMGRLSLSRLNLKQFNADATSFRDVQRTWPCLTVLSIPDQTLTLEHLVYLSRLPRLEKITAGGFGDMGEVPEAQGRTSSPLQIIELRCVYVRVKIKSIENVARSVL